MPEIGFHSVIERPELVSRVMPPSATIARTSAARTVEPDADGAQPVGGSVGGGGGEGGQGVSFSGPRGIGKPPLLAMVMVTQR